MEQVTHNTQSRIIALNEQIHNKFKRSERDKVDTRNLFLKISIK